MKLIAWEILCVALFWSVFCRSVRVNQTVRLDVRLAILGVGIAALVGMGAPVYGWMPDGVVIVIVTAVVVMQAVMAHHWRHGVPYQFLRDLYRPKRRAGDSPP